METCTILHNVLIQLITGGEIFDEEDVLDNPMHPNQIVAEFNYETCVTTDQFEPLASQNQDTNNKWMEQLISTGSLIRNQDAHAQQVSQ